jgi:hypothetical protein
MSSPPTTDKYTSVKLPIQVPRARFLVLQVTSLLLELRQVPPFFISLPLPVSRAPPFPLCLLQVQFLSFFHQVGSRSVAANRRIAERWTPLNN